MPVYVGCGVVDAKPSVILYSMHVAAVIADERKILLFVFFSLLVYKAHIPLNIIWPIGNSSSYIDKLIYMLPFILPHKEKKKLASCVAWHEYMA